jgi:hypothetical protein
MIKTPSLEWKLNIKVKIFEYMRNWVITMSNSEILKSIVMNILFKPWIKAMVSNSR